MLQFHHSFLFPGEVTVGPILTFVLSQYQFTQGVQGVFYYCPAGWVPSEASSAQPFRDWLHKFEGETGVSKSRGSTLIALNAGLMKPRKGFTTVMGKKNGGGPRGFSD